MFYLSRKINKTHGLVKFRPFLTDEPWGHSSTMFHQAYEQKV